jgi:hypothetical protein
MCTLILSPSILPSNGHWGFFPWAENSQSIKLTIHLHLV